MLHSFLPDELNAHFANVPVLQEESNETASDIIEVAEENGFAFKPVSLDDACMAVRPFSSQASGKDGIPQCGC